MEMVILVLKIVILFLTVGNVSFMKRKESLWLFVLTAAVFLPFNIKLAAAAVNVYLKDSPVVTRFLFGTALYLDLFSAEEIFLGVIARILWPRQKAIFLYAKKKIDEKEKVEICTG